MKKKYIVLIVICITILFSICAFLFGRTKEDGEETVLNIKQNEAAKAELSDTKYDVEINLNDDKKDETYIMIESTLFEEGKNEQDKKGLYSYIRKLKKIDGTKTKYDIWTSDYIYKENVIGEPEVFFTCYNDNEKVTYQYYFLNINNAVDWIKTNGDKNQTYNMIDTNDIYENTMKASYENDEWIVGMVGKRGSITLDEFAKGKEFVEIISNSTSSENNACTLEEFTEKYSGDFDADEDAEDWWFDYGCESPN